MLLSYTRFSAVMSCESCGVPLIIIDEDLICPACSGIKILDKDTALKVITKQIDWFDREFEVALNAFDRRRLMVWLFGYREKMSSAFFEKPAIKLSEFLSVNVLIRKVLLSAISGRDQANDENTPQLISLYGDHIKLCEEKSLIEENFGEYSFKKEFDIDNISIESLMSNFKFHFSEEYLPIFESFKDNLIFNSKHATQYLEKFHEEYDAAKGSRTLPKKITPKETIHLLFPFIRSFFWALTKNKLYAQVFDLEKISAEDVSPEQLLKLINSFTQKPGLISMVPIAQFNHAVIYSTLDLAVIQRTLVVSLNKSSDFCFFLEIEGQVLVSPNFIRLVALLHYPFHYKQFLKEEIDSRSIDFEQNTIPERLRQLGFVDGKPVLVPSLLQIDRIAWKGKRLLVIEVKQWDIRPYFEHRRVHVDRERELKGVVDGIRFSHIDGAERQKNVPSLLQKIKYVQDNISTLCADYQKIERVEGVVITKSCPPLSEYKGVKFVGLPKINELS